MRKGGISIFCVLVMMLTSSVLFTLIEAARFQEMRHISQLQTELAVESVFTNYNKTLWEKYHLLGCEHAEAEEILIKAANGRSGANKHGLNLLVCEVCKADIKGYTLLTDGNGSAYIKAVSSYMKENMLYDTAKGIYNQYEVLKSIKDSGEMNFESIDIALQTLSVLWETAKESESEQAIETGEEVSKNRSKGKEVAYAGPNPLQEVKELGKMGILELLLGDTSQLSQKKIEERDIVSQRKLMQGKNSVVAQVEWVDEVFLQQYLISYFTNYCDKERGGGLCYELEYVINGRTSDIENLEAVAKQLLGLREITNFLYLTSDVRKVEEASVLAMALAGASANPIIIETVKLGLLTAWAFGESVLDVRALLQGKRVPLLKSAESWTLQLTEIGTLLRNDISAKEMEYGLSYKDYLGILVLFQSKDHLAMRSMDVQEIQIRSMDGQENFRMDELMVNAQVEMRYGYKPIFLSFSNLKIGELEDGEIWTQIRYAYDRKQVIEDVPLDS